MKKKQMYLGIYLPIVFIMVAAAVALRTAAIFTDLDPLTGYYGDKTLLTAASVIIAASVLFGLSYLIFGNRRLKLAASFDTPATYIPSATVAVSLLFVAFGLVRDVSAKSHGIYDGEFLRSNALPLITAFLALLAIVGFFLTSFSPKRENLSRAAFGIMTVIFILAYAAMLYFDDSMPMNAPDRIVDLMAYVIASIFFLYEIRLSLGRDVWFAYISFGMVGGAVTAYSSIPSIIAYFVTGQTVSSSLYESILTFSLLVFTASRVLLTLKLTEDKDIPFVEMIKAAERKRNAEAEESEEILDDTKDEVANYTFDIAEQKQDSEEGQ